MSILIHKPLCKLGRHYPDGNHVFEREMYSLGPHSSDRRLVRRQLVTFCRFCDTQLESTSYRSRKERTYALKHQRKRRL